MVLLLVFRRWKELGVAIVLNNVWPSALTDLLALESCGLVSSSQGLKFAWWWATAPMKELVKKGRGSGMTWTGLGIE